MAPASTIVCIQAMLLGGLGVHLYLPHFLSPIHIVFFSILLITLTTIYAIRRPRPVYLVDYACFSPNCTYRYPKETFLEHCHLAPFYDDVSVVQFIARILEISGLGDETSAPPSIHYILPHSSLEEARDEIEAVIFSTVDDILSRTSINADEIDILVVNCGAFSPSPAIADMIISRYKLRGDIRMINLSGMGCSAGLVSVGLVRDLLQAMPCGSHALVISTETTTPHYYQGRNRSMLLTNILFRMGAFAALLSTSRAKARYELLKVVRTLTSAQDKSYRCVFHDEDTEGIRGTNLSKDLMTVAGNTLRANITIIGRHFLPAVEKLKYFLNFTLRKMLNGKIRTHIPNFCTAFEHFCIHAGGPAVINSVQESLNLPEKLVEPSRMTLHRFGNQSTSSVWYELAYIEAKYLMQQGDKVLMIGFGAGYECTTAVWVCIRPSVATSGPWARCIHRYPVDVSRGA